MARIPDAELERLKQTVSLERLVERAGVVLKRHGGRLGDEAPGRVVPARGGDPARGRGLRWCDAGRRCAGTHWRSVPRGRS